tara:strand:+ start:16221 stop:16685 length:465 start_codon:yes stop_codon:yes gene_type:complete
MIKVNVILSSNSWKKPAKNLKSFIDKKIRIINKKSKLFKKNILSCSLLLSGNKEIKKLNKQFRNKDKSTDVLSFPFYEKKEMINKIKFEKEIYLGDIIVNLDKIKNKTNQKIFKDELIKLWIHGLAHLLGYRHKKEKDFNKMKKVESDFYNFIK